MTAPAISILLPTHNRADVLPFAIQSVLAQGRSDFELLIAGDGCTDDTAEVVRGFADDRIRWFDLPKAPHQGYANRNRVLRQARGELIGYMQDDDLWLPDHLELLSELLDRRKADLAFSRLLFVSLEGTISVRTDNLDDPIFLARVLARKTGLGMTCAMHRRSCFERYGYLDERLPIAGDVDYWPRFLEGSDPARLAYLPLPTCFHFTARWRRDSWLKGLRRRIYQLEGSMPPELLLHIPPGMSAQEALWNTMNGDGGQWPLRLRQAVQVHLDRRASAFYPSTLLEFLNARYKRLRSGRPI